MRTLKDLVRPNIWALAPFSSARDEFTGRAEVFLDANENPFESHHNRYPDSDHRRLRAVIADWRSISMDQILLGNGSDELIDMIVRTFCTPATTRYIPNVGAMVQISSTPGVQNVLTIMSISSSDP
ncbi:MAG: hypothetical protein AAFQ02_12185, partial [Bacteroidota bacterium]